MLNWYIIFNNNANLLLVNIIFNTYKIEIHIYLYTNHHMLIWMSMGYVEKNLMH